MIAGPECAHTEVKKHGYTKSGVQRFRCKTCGAAMTAKTNLLSGMRLSIERVEQIVNCLVEGCSVRSTARMTNTDDETICDLIVMLGQRCKRFMEQRIRNVPVKDVQADEIWSFVYCKNRTRQKLSLSIAEHGDQYCFVGMERHTKLVLAWHLGPRDMDNGRSFVQKLAHATAKSPFQMTTDGWVQYQSLVPGWMREHRVDFAVLIKVYDKSQEEIRYSPPRIISTKRKRVCGAPDMERACTSHVERSNLSIRMGLRRFTRLTNGFSKKIENHEAALALYFAHYNFCRKHMTLKTTPAMASGLTDHPWTVRELLELTA